MATETPAAPATTQAADSTTPAADTTTPAAGDTTGKTPTAEETTAGATDAQATPIVPDKYVLTLPEGSAFDERDLVGISETAKALGLTNDAAQKMLEIQDEQIERARAEYLVELEADPVLGGAKLEETAELARKGRDLMFPPGSKGAAMIGDWFKRTGLDNHVLLVEAFASLGRRMAEDSGVPAGGKGGSEDSLTPAERRYGKDGKGRPAETVQG